MSGFQLDNTKQVEDLEVSNAQMGTLMGVSKSMIGKWVADGIFSRTDSGKLNVRSCIVRYIEKLKRENGQDEDKKTASAYEKARAQKMAAQAEKEELDLLKKRGKVIEIDQVADIVESEYAVTRQKLFSIPNKAAVDVFHCETPDEVQTVLMNYVNEALSGLIGDIDPEAIADSEEGVEAGSEADAT